VVRAYFLNKDLNLNKIEKFVYNRDCLKSTFDKTFENMISISDKMKQLEKELANNENNLEKKHNLSDDDIEKDRKLFYLDFSQAKNRKTSNINDPATYKIT